MERKAHILSFDLVKNSGVILTENRKEHDFNAASISGKIPELNNYPAVIATLEGDNVISLIFDPDTPRLKEAPASGLAVLGAAKCPQCDWRLPMVPSPDLPKIRKGESFNCPECQTLLKLKSFLIGKHHIIAVAIVATGLLAFRRLPYIEYKIGAILLMFLALIYIHLLEKLIVDDVGTAFD